MGNRSEGFSAAVLDDDTRRRDWVAREVASLGGEVHANAGHGIVGGQAVYQAAPQVAFVSFEEPYVRATATITHAAITSKVVAYTTDSAVGAYQAAIRAGAHIVLSSPPSRAELQQAVERVLPRKAPPAGAAHGQVVVAASAKGGTGKSTIATHLAAMLAREHASSVLLIDFATDFGDAGLLLNLGEGMSTARAARQVARAELDEFRESLGYHESGLFVLAAPQRFSERVPVQVNELEALLQLATQTFDHVVIDTAAVFDDTLMLAMAAADLALVTASPDVLSVANTRLFLRAVDEEGLAGDHLLPVLVATDKQGAISGADAADVLERPGIWEVPFDGQVLRANQRGIQAAPRRPTPAIRSLRALAGRIAQDPAHIERRAGARPARSQVDPAYRDRLKRLVAPVVSQEEPAIGAKAVAATNVRAVVYSTGPSVSVFHVESCAAGARIRPDYRVTVDRAELPIGLRPCKICAGTAAAA